MFDVNLGGVGFAAAMKLLADFGKEDKAPRATKAGTRGWQFLPA